MGYFSRRNRSRRKSDRRVCLVVFIFVIWLVVKDIMASLFKKKTVEGEYKAEMR